MGQEIGKTDLTELRRLHEAATKGEWRADDRDQLRAELAAAKEQQIATLIELQLFREHTTALAADNARLRRALQPFADRIKAYPPWMWTAMVEREKEGIITGGFMVGNEAVTHMPAMLLVQAEEALAATPAQSLAAHDAAVRVAALREICKNRSCGGMCRSVAVDYYEWMGKQPPEGELSQRPVTRVAVIDASEVMAEADRIEKKAQSGKTGS